MFLFTLEDRCGLVPRESLIGELCLPIRVHPEGNWPLQPRNKGELARKIAAGLRNRANKGSVRIAKELRDSLTTAPLREVYRGVLVCHVPEAMENLAPWEGVYFLAGAWAQKVADRELRRGGKPERVELTREKLEARTSYEIVSGRIEHGIAHLRRVHEEKYCGPFRLPHAAELLGEVLAREA